MEKAKTYDHLFKLLMIGDGDVGKTGLLFRFSDDSFNCTSVSTISVDFKIKKLEMEGKTIKLQIWDTAGQERFHTITTSYYRGAHGVMLVYDITKERSFLNLERWYRNINEHASEDISIVVVGNNCEKKDQRQVTKERGEAFAKERGLPFFEVSAKYKINVVVAFTELARIILHKPPADTTEGKATLQRLPKTVKLSKTYDYLFKLLLIGDADVGKTGLLFRFSEDTFNSTFISTIGVDFKIKNLQLEGKTIKLLIWDTAGQERFRTITTAYYRGALGVLLVYDITKERSFLNLEQWYRNINDHASEDISIVVSGNNCEKEDQRQVTKERGEAYAMERGLPFFEVSAKYNINVVEAFTELARIILHKLPVEAPKDNATLQLDAVDNTGKGSARC